MAAVVGDFSGRRSEICLRYELTPYEKRFNRHSSESGPRGKASGRSQWVFASKATLPTPFLAYSNAPGLTELLRLYACGLQPRPSVQLSSSRVTANDNGYSREN